MKNHVEEIKVERLAVITGGKYYGNGVTCTKKHGCSVNWGQAMSCGVSRFANWGHGNC
ncbi:leucocin A/sakacin P family class II bacteriocin [Secundilactobacillus kimchicus]|uniref:leucocin A/sakacin P family class II bacteriocin n=1 Tax=Secundilactobacillus kimchicus TaxID=528209 RepID=UPI0024A84F05|nr:leucocin A/sakacin P family class II bacteriocin [Secundilactobacillus kimchicus]